MLCYRDGDAAIPGFLDDYAFFILALADLYETFFDVLEISTAPIIASHSCARAICDNPRNLTDDMLRALAKNGGVIQICIYDAYVKKGLPNPARDQALKDLRAEYGEYEKLFSDE